MPKQKTEKVEFAEPRDSRAGRQRAQASRTQIVRGLLPPELSVMWMLAILAGWDPIIVPDPRAASGWRIEALLNGDRPSIAEKAAALIKLNEWGWGVGGTAKDVEASLRAAAPDEVKQVREALSEAKPDIVIGLLNLLTQASSAKQVTVVPHRSLKPPASNPEPVEELEPEQGVQAGDYESE